MALGVRNMYLDGVLLWFLWKKPGWKKEDEEEEERDKWKSQITPKNYFRKGSL